MQPDEGQTNHGDEGGDHQNPWREAQHRREPVFNLPGIIVAIAVVLTAFHAIRYFFLSDEADINLVYLLGFVPATYGQFASSAPYPMAGLWSPVTYGLLHGDWLHLLMNLFWMAAFGTPVARRFGPVRFLVLTVIASIGGAALHYATYYNEFAPVIGASGAVSGYMGAAGRFAFSTTGRGTRFNSDGPALGILQSFQNRQFVIFFAVWMGMNYLFGSGIVGPSGVDSPIAWQAHIGGFVTGFLAFSLLDPQKARIQP